MTADQIRAAMGQDFCAVADALRDTFAAKLVYLKAPGVQVGRDPSAGSVRADGKLDDESERLRYWYGQKKVGL